VKPIRHAIAAEVVAIGCVGAYNLVVPRIPQQARLPANLGAALALAGVARAVGMRASDLGLARGSVRRGIRVGLAAATPLALGAATAVAIPQTRKLLADERITGTSRSEAAFETLVRIPLETALAEEVIFRGVLLALGQSSRSRASAVVSSSMIFGLWHVVPTLSSLTRDTNGRPDARATASTTAVVATTAVAGAGFALLRLRADSVIAPIIAHAALNMVAFAGTRIAGAR
jgi:membrane protease YdiL (CAAX protease family)